MNHNTNNNSNNNIPGRDLFRATGCRANATGKPSGKAVCGPAPGGGRKARRR